MKVLLLALGTTALTALVVSNAYYKKEQFYPTVVYLFNSNRSLCVLYIQAFVMLYLLCALLKKMFFGTLRPAEVEHLIESSWFAVLETFILFAAFHQELNITFVGMISVLFVMKSFHWLAGDRIDYMERSPLISWLFHIRAVSLLLTLCVLDYLFISRAVHSMSNRGLTVEIVFGLEYAVMFLNAINTMFRYFLHTIDLQSEDPWENKTIYMRFVDIIVGFFKLLIYLSYMSFMLYVLFIPLHIARRIFITAKNFQKNIADVVSSHSAIRNLNTLYPDATPEELNTANNVCIICREDMADRCKKLPCNHIFHMACLRSWFQRQQTCPTCRLDVLSESVLNRAGQNRQRQQQQNNNAQGQQGPEAQQQGQDGQQRVPPGVMFPPMMWPGMVPPGMPPQQNQPPQQPGQPPVPEQQHPPQNSGGPPNQPGQATQQPTTTNSPPGNPTMMGGPPMPPPFMVPPPFMAGPGFGMMPPFGGMPSGDTLRGLDDEQLRSLEGMERANVEARIEVLRNVQRLLDSAVTQLNQYSAVMATLGPQAGPGFHGYPTPPDGAGFHGNPTLSDDQQVLSFASTPQPKAESQTSYTGSTSKLTELKPSFSFSAGDIDNETEGVDNETETGGVDNETENIDPSEVVKSKPSVVDQEPIEDMEGIRNRRLQRFNSLPQTGTPVSVNQDNKDKTNSANE